MKLSKSQQQPPTQTHEVPEYPFQHGIPEKLCSDNSTNFENSLMADLARNWGFTLVTSAPNNQQVNGKAEATVKIAKRLVKKSIISGSDLWYMLVPYEIRQTK